MKKNTIVATSVAAGIIGITGIAAFVTKLRKHQEKNRRPHHLISLNKENAKLFPKSDFVVTIADGEIVKWERLSYESQICGPDNCRYVVGLVNGKVKATNLDTTVNLNGHLCEIHNRAVKEYKKLGIKVAEEECY